MWELLTLTVKSINFWWCCQKTSYSTIEMQDHVIFTYFRGASSLKTHFPLSSCSILHKPVWARSFQKRPCQIQWSFHFNVLSLHGIQTIFCSACRETDQFDGSSRFTRINLMTFVASYAGNHGAVNLNGSFICQKPWSSQSKSHGMRSFICRKPWSCRSKRINLMAFIASCAENHGAVNLNA